MTQKLIKSRTVSFEGAHRMGKSTTVSRLNQRQQFSDSHCDRSWASTYAFGKVFDRPAMDLDQAINDYFANPSAATVYFEMWAEDYQTDFELGLDMRANWHGFYPQVQNRVLDSHIRFAIERAEQLGYSSRILRLRSRAQEPEVQCQQILDWLESVLPS